jgi:uncharacterized Zn-binding protein involved in type VI secretion
MPAAARVGDPHVCEHTDPEPHLGGPILSGCPTVFIGEENAARVGDRAWCDGGQPDVITSGEATVLIGKKAAARRGDTTDGGHICDGCATVLIGTPTRRHALRRAAQRNRRVAISSK